MLVYEVNDLKKEKEELEAAIKTESSTGTNLGSIVDEPETAEDRPVHLKRDGANSFNT